MRKSIIAATFGGALAAGFLWAGAPLANAVPCDTSVNPPGQVCESCLTANMWNGQTNTCFGHPPVAPPGGKDPDGFYGGNQACRESGICQWNPYTTPGS